MFADRRMSPVIVSWKASAPHRNRRDGGWIESEKTARPGWTRSGYMAGVPVQGKESIDTLIVVRGEGPERW